MCFGTIEDNNPECKECPVKIECSKESEVKV